MVGGRRPRGVLVLAVSAEQRRGCEYRHHADDCRSHRSLQGRQPDRLVRCRADDTVSATVQKSLPDGGIQMLRRWKVHENVQQARGSRQTITRKAKRRWPSWCRGCGASLEMPGLRLTVAQAARLWALDQTTSAQILSMLTATGFLWRNPTGAYVRVSVG
jgi:hypothetical protein